MSLDTLDPTCANCGHPASWHSAIDNRCPDDDSPHPESETYDVGVQDGRFVRTTSAAVDPVHDHHAQLTAKTDAERDELRALRHVEALDTLDDAADDELRLAEHAAEARFNRSVRAAHDDGREDWRDDAPATAAHAALVAIRGERNERRILADPRCTAYVDDLGYIAHDGDTCPVHESGDNDTGDEIGAELDTAGMARALDVIRRQLVELVDRGERENVCERRSLTGGFLVEAAEALAHAVDLLQQEGGQS